MKKCVRCGKHLAAVPDRNNCGMVERVCRPCHGAELTQDLENIMKQAAERRSATKPQDTGGVDP